MNRFLTAIAIVSTLSIIQGCTTLSQANQDSAAGGSHQSHSSDVIAADQSAAKSVDQSADRSADQAISPTANHVESHTESHTESHARQGEHHDTPAASTQAKLTTSAPLTANTPALLQINIQDRDGKAIAQFDRFQEQVMHLIAVSDDLQVFQHIHPTHRGNGRFEVEAQFPQAGRYTLFSDYQPTGQAEQVSVLRTQVSGSVAPAADIDWSDTKIFGQTAVDLTRTPTVIRAGEEVILQFNLQDTATGQPVTDLQPYLGEQGHLVIVRQAPVLARENYIHAHAVHQTPAHQVHFATRFLQPGRYKLWGQFNRNGEIITADFWVNVAEGAP